MTITFSRHAGGIVVRLNNNLAGIIFYPDAEFDSFRFINHRGDDISCKTLNEAKRSAADSLIEDYG